MAIFNVRNFGAKGDGITDDTKAIQAAVDAAHQAGGGDVYLPTGTYAVTSAGIAANGCVVLTDNITMHGDGMGLTVVKLKDGSTAPIDGIIRTQHGVQNHDVFVHDL